MGAYPLARGVGRGAGDDTVIEHYGKPMAVVVSYADWQALQDELDDLRAARPGSL